MNQENIWKYKSPDCKGGILKDGTFIFDEDCELCKKLQKLENG